MSNPKKLHREVAWLLENEVPMVLGHVSKLLNSCLGHAVSNVSHKYHLTCTSSTSGLEVMRGSLILHQDTLCGMEVFMKPNKTLATVKASFRSDKQWKLQQIQDAVNHLKTVNCMMDTVISEQQSISHSAEGIVFILEDAIRQLIRCQVRLTTPCQLSLNTLIGNAFAKMFVPPLPGDTLVNLYILEDRLVMTYYTVQQAHTNASLSPNKNGKLHPPNNSEKGLFHHTGSMFDHAGVRYEMATANTAECVIPSLTDILGTAAYVQTVFQNLKDKLNTLTLFWGSDRRNAISPGGYMK